MSNQNPITELAEKVQKMYGQNILTRVVSKTGEDHDPTILVEIELPDGRTYEAFGGNQKIAKQKAAQKALLDLPFKL